MGPCTQPQPPAVCCRSLTNCLACIDEEEDEPWEEDEEEFPTAADDDGNEPGGPPGDDNGRSRRRRRQHQRRRTGQSGGGSAFAAGLRDWLGGVMGSVLPSSVASSQRRCVRMSIRVREIVLI